VILVSVLKLQTIQTRTSATPNIDIVKSFSSSYSDCCH
jgi:hypothetical protein